MHLRPGLRPESRWASLQCPQTGRPLPKHSLRLTPKNFGPSGLRSGPSRQIPILFSTYPSVQPSYSHSTSVFPPLPYTFSTNPAGDFGSAISYFEVKYTHFTKTNLYFLKRTLSGEEPLNSESLIVQYLTINFVLKENCSCSVGSLDPQLTLHTYPLPTAPRI